MLHKYPVAAEEVKATESPEHKVVGPPAVMVGIAGKALTVMVTLPDFLQPLPSVMVTDFPPLLLTLSV